MARRPRIARQRSVTFEVTINDQQRSNRPTSPHDMMNDWHVSDIEADVRNIIERDLPKELSSLFDIEVETKVVGTKNGSLIVFFSAAIAAYPLIASYNDFYESVHLIRKHCSLLLDALAKSKYGGSLSTSVSVYHPSIPDPGDYPYRWMRHLFGHPGGEEAFALTAWMQRPTNAPRRDVFFWYLVVMNIVLILLVGSLVYRSVVSTYYERPTIPAASATHIK